jgi:hypothetical protein
LPKHTNPKIEGKLPKLTLIPSTSSPDYDFRGQAGQEYSKTFKNGQKLYAILRPYFAKATQGRQAPYFACATQGKQDKLFKNCIEMDKNYMEIFNNLGWLIG